MPAKKICIICGAEFEPRYNLVKTQKCCSLQCSREHYKHYVYDDETRKWYRRKKRRNNREVLCKICGQPTIASESGRKRHYHESCIIQDCINTILQNKFLSKNQLNRIYTLGYATADIRKMAKECKNENN